MSWPIRLGSRCGNACLDVGELRVDDQRGQAHQDPRPGPQHVMRDVEKQRASQRVLFGFRGQHALRDVAAAARLRPRIPHGPPLHRDGHDEHGHRQVPVVLEIGQHRQVVHASRAVHLRHLRHQPVQPAHLRQRNREVSRRDHRRHFDEELEHVDHQHAPQPRMRGEHHVQQAHRQQRLPALEAEEHGRDLHRRQVHRGHDHAVEQQPQVDRPEAAHRAGRLARVAHLVKLEIRQHSGPTPQPRIEEDRRDPREGEGPPLPVARHALRADEVGHQVRRIARERGGHHRKPRQPPRHRTARGEELRRVFSRSLSKEQRRDEADGDSDKRDYPVEGVEVHKLTFPVRRGRRPKARLQSPGAAPARGRSPPAWGAGRK